MKNLGQLYLHDVREAPLIEAKKRFAKSGMTNVQFHCGEENLRKFTGRFDWLVLDVPCTGTGTIRRNPDLKWKFSEESLKNLVSTQRGRVVSNHQRSFKMP
jgi:16S rRNA (cytosine967-C5)-methyltransferase